MPVVLPGDDRAVVRAAEDDFAGFEFAVVAAHLDRCAPLLGIAVAVAVAVLERVARVVEGQAVGVRDVRGVDRVRPAQPLVEAGGGQRAARVHRAREVEPLVAHHVHLREHARAVPGLVRIDEEHRVAVAGLRRGDGPLVRAQRRGQLLRQPREPSARRVGGAEQPAQDHVALEGEYVERLHPVEQARLLLGVPFQVVVVAGGEALGDAPDVLGQVREVAPGAPDQVEEGDFEIAAEA